jgi:serine/threonine protein kinase
MKKVNKSRLQDYSLVSSATNERSILAVVDCPFIVKLYYSFQTSKCLYFIIQYAEGGEIFHYLKKHRRFSENTARFYSAEIILALEYLHSKGIVYGDLKPENVLINFDGHILLSDFGLSRFKSIKGTMQSTPEYMAPEQILGKDSYQAVDWWALVCLLGRHAV